jgi:arylformamidase
MIATIEKNQTYKVDFSKPIDISLPLCAGTNNVNAWWAVPPIIEAVVMGSFIGDVNKGGSVNFKNVFFNPHGNGTHTECVGHISSEPYTLHQCLKQFVFVAQVVSVTPSLTVANDSVIFLDQLKPEQWHEHAEAIIVRTLPNTDIKKTKQYSGTNFAYVDTGVMNYLVEKNISHFLIDLPSVDREEDEGALAAHHAFWQYPHKTRKHATITEFVFVENHIPDGLYILNLQITSLQNDASPSKPVLYALL